MLCLETRQRADGLGRGRPVALEQPLPLERRPFRSRTDSCRTLVTDPRRSPPEPLAAPASGGVDEAAGRRDHQVGPIDLDHVAGAPRELEADRPRRQRLVGRDDGGLDGLVRGRVEARLGSRRAQHLDRDAGQVRLAELTLRRRPVEVLDIGHERPQAVEPLLVLRLAACPAADGRRPSRGPRRTCRAARCPATSSRYRPPNTRA